MSIARKRSLVERILTYHRKDKPKDWKGGRLEVRQIAQLGQGVACVYDSEKEFDLFFDVDEWDLGTKGLEHYNVAEESLDLAMGSIYGMACIMEGKAGPDHQRMDSFYRAQEVARKLLRPKQIQSELYDLPMIVFPTLGDA